MVENAKKVFKIIVAGNGGIGKTTLMKLFCYNEYSEDQKLTVGNEIFLKKFKVNGKPEYLQVWDLGGQEHFRFLLSSFMKGSVGAILGFEMNRRKSFLDLKGWLDLLRSHELNLPIVLIGTKKDRGYHPTLNPTIVDNFIKQFNLENFIEISSKENQNIEEPFKLLIQYIKGCPLESIEFLTYEPELTKSSHV